MDLRPGIVRILDTDEETAGTGFVVTAEGLIATCAHVVELAGSAAGDTVSLVFHATGEEREATVKREYWTDRNAQDVAILELKGSLPEDVVPLLLGSSPGSQTHNFGTFGFSAAKPEEGMPGVGTFTGWTTDNTFEVLQFHSWEVTHGFSGAPALDDSKRRVVGMIVSIIEPDESLRQIGTGYIIPTETLRSVCSVLEPSDVCPYRGLDAFTEDDAKYFFGRGEVVNQLLEKLEDEPPLLTVLGPSGSGKSSVVQAGVIARLRQGQLYSSNRWGIFVNRQYGEDSFRSLAQQGLEGAEDDLIHATEVWLKQNSDKERLLLVLDQFEQLLVERPERQQQDFLRQLTQLSREPLAVTVVLVMRDDFFSRFAQRAHALLDEALGSGWAYHIPGELSKDDLDDIVQEPGVAVGLTFETGLVDTIIKDARQPTSVSDETGEPIARTTILPLLEFALTQLWEEDHRKGELTHETYNRIGGVAGSLRRWANKALRSLDKELQSIARRVLTDLVHLGDESEGVPDSRRIRSFDELCRNTDERQMVQQVVRKLTDARLLVTAGETSGGKSSVQMIHDRLLLEWTQLQDWLRDNRRILLWHQEMERRTQAWEDTEPDDASQRDEGKLLRGRDLAEAEGWLREHGEDVGEAERKFIEASRQAETDRQRRQTQRQRRLRGAGALFVMVVMVLGLVSFLGWRQARSNAQAAEMQARIALSRQLLAQASEVQESQPDLSLLLNAEALKRAPATAKGEARFALLSKLTRPYHVATQLTGHFATVNDVAFSAPDGNLLASASLDGTVRLWDAKSGKQRGQPLTGHEEPVYNVAFSPKDDLLASAGEDGTVRLWDAKSGEQRGQPLTGHKDTVYSVAFSPNGKLLASAGEDGTVRLWDAESGKQRGQPLTGHNGKVKDVAFSPNGKVLASASVDKTVRLWDVASKEAHGQPLSGHDDEVEDVAFSPDGDLLASAGEDETVRFWDAVSGRPRGEPFTGHTGLVYGLEFSPDGERLASSSDDETVRLWDVASDRPRVELLSGHNDEVEGVAFSPEDDLLASAGDDRKVRLWDVASDNPSGEPLTGHKGPVNGVAFSPDGKLLASASEDETVRLWDVASDRPRVELLSGHNDEVKGVAFSPDGKLLASGGDDEDQTVRLWDVASGEQRGKPLTGHEGAVHSLAFSPDGDLLASAGEDETVRLWDVASRKPYGEPLTGHEGEVKGVAFSAPDGKLLASASDDRTLRLWDVESGEQHGQPLTGHGGFVWGVAFSPDGKLLASASADQTVRLWDEATEEARGQPLTGHDHSVNEVAFSPDGKMLASASVDETVGLWDIEVESLIADACRTANRNLSKDEWIRFVGAEFKYARTCSSLPAGYGAT